LKEQFSRLTSAIDFDGILPALWSAHGNSPAPPIIKEYWIPFMASSPIILHTNLLRAAIWRIANQSTASEICAHHISHPNQWMGTKESLEILTLKSKSISLLNARLRSPGGMSVDDEAIASVIFFFYNEVGARHLLRPQKDFADVIDL
jgi:hypothetical protein